jgi:hypothetical protein
MSKSSDEAIEGMELSRATSEDVRRWNNIAAQIANDLTSEVNEDALEGLNVLSVIVLMYILRCCKKGYEEPAVEQFLTLLRIQFEAHMSATFGSPWLN